MEGITSCRLFQLKPCPDAAEQDDLCYSHVHFSEGHTDSRVQLRERENVLYAVVNSTQTHSEWESVVLKDSGSNPTSILSKCYWTSLTHNTTLTLSADFCVWFCSLTHSLLREHSCFCTVENTQLVAKREFTHPLWYPDRYPASKEHSLFVELHISHFQSPCSCGKQFALIILFQF